MASLRAYFTVILMILISSSLSQAHPGSFFNWGEGGGSTGEYFGLFPEFYQYACPQVNDIVMSVLERAIAEEARLAASLLRLHFHDCFVQVIYMSTILYNSFPSCFVIFSCNSFFACMVHLITKSYQAHLRWDMPQQSGADPFASAPGQIWKSQN